MISLIPVRSEARELLWNINQKYLYEMTLYYSDPMDENGNFHYGHFDEYFTDPDRHAYFLYHEKDLIGFAMIHPYSYLGRRSDHVLAEFTVFPAFRRKHYAREAVQTILSSRKGRWEIKYNEKNAAAKALWTKAAAPYHPSAARLNEEETVLEFEN